MSLPGTNAKWRHVCFSAAIRTKADLKHAPPWRRNLSDVATSLAMGRLGGQFFGLISRRANGLGKPPQVQPKDLTVLPRQRKGAVSWHSGFRRGPHARPQTTPIRHAAWRHGGDVAFCGARAAEAAYHRIPGREFACGPAAMDGCVCAAVT